MTASECSVVIFRGRPQNFEPKQLAHEVARPFERNFVFKMTANECSIIIFEGGLSLKFQFKTVRP